MSFLDGLENGPSAGKKILLIDANGGPETLGDLPNLGLDGASDPAVSVLNGDVEFYDDFNRADTVEGDDITDALTGQTYDLRTDGGDRINRHVYIKDGSLQAESGQVYYLGGQLIADKVINMGARVSWREADDADRVIDADERPLSLGAQLVLIIKNDDNWLGEFIHVIISRRRCAIQMTDGVAGGGGVGGLVTLASTVNDGGLYAVEPHNRPMDGRLATYEILISGERIILLCDGASILEYEGPEVPLNNGNWIYWEQFGGGLDDQLTMHELWANDLRNGGDVIGKRLMPYSSTLERLASGQANFPTGGTIATGNLAIPNGAVKPREVDIQPRLANGRDWTYRAGGQYRHLGTVKNSPANADDAVLFTLLKPDYILRDVGDYYEIKIIGEFANNANLKKFKISAIHTGTVETTETAHTGFFECAIRVTITSENTFMSYTKIEGNFDSVHAGTKVGNSNINFEDAITHSFRASGVAAGDVKIHSAHVFVQPVSGTTSI